jgi:hypothetical protein
MLNKKIEYPQMGRNGTFLGYQCWNEFNQNYMEQKPSLKAKRISSD